MSIVTPAVYSKRKGADPIPEGAVYVGRPTQFGNPFTVGGNVTNAIAVEWYAEWLNTPEGQVIADRARRELAGKDLVCWCQSPSDENPLPCHAAVLLEIANPERRKEPS